MKKNTKKKSSAKKTKAKKVEKSKITKVPKTPSMSAAANQDIVGLLTLLVQKLTSFEEKIDKVLSSITSQTIAAPKQQPAIVHLPKQNRENRHMHKAVCADCGLDCEVPFKPRQDRQVYCKECFIKRRTKGIFKPQEARQGDKGSGQGRGLAVGDFKEESQRTDRPKKELLVNVAPAEKPKAVKPAKFPKKYPKKKKPAVKNKRAKR